MPSLFQEATGTSLLSSRQPGEVAGVTIPGGVQKTCRYGSSGHGL